MMSYHPSSQSESIIQTPILIIGTGFAGLGMGIRLKRAGFDEFIILERADDIGGTWRDNHYPGCACDVQSHLYSFSFEPNPRWSRMFAPQAEIQAYLQHCTEKYGLRRHVRCGENLVRAEYDDARRSWKVRTASGQRYQAPVLISAMGGLSNPAYPHLPGLEQFEGKAFHSAQWEHDYPLAGKRVAVVGTGASAIQFVPEIAPQVASLDVYQRTAPWVVPKPDRPMRGWERWLFQHVPFTQRFLRAAIYWLLEARILGLVIHPKLMKLAENAARRYIKRQISDPELRRKVTPEYTMGCKRVLLSDNWYPALTRSNVNLVSDAIAEVRAHSIVTTDGREREIDAIIYGTGFTVQLPLPRQTILGRGGQDIWDAWPQGSVEAYKGASVAGFPNLFFLAGPNTGLGHTSMVVMIEAQIAYVVDALKQMRTQGWESLDVKPDVQAAYNARIQAKSQGAVWQSGCKSWYLDANGKNSTLWPTFTFVFRRLTERFDAQSYAIEAALPVPARVEPESTVMPAHAPSHQMDEGTV